MKIITKLLLSLHTDITKSTFTWFINLTLCGVVCAQPSFSKSQLVTDQMVYQDLKQSSVYYYIPFGYQLAVDASGKPDFSLIQMRYTGTRATADEGVSKFNNLVQFRVVIDPKQYGQVTTLRTALRKLYPNAELRP